MANTLTLPIWDLAGVHEIQEDVVRHLLRDLTDIAEGECHRFTNPEHRRIVDRALGRVLERMRRTGLGARVTSAS